MGSGFDNPRVGSASVHVLTITEGRWCLLNFTTRLLMPRKWSRLCHSIASVSICKLCSNHLSSDVNVLDILKYDSLVLTPDSIAYLEERLAPETWTGTSDIHWFDDEDFEASFIQELDEAYNELVQSKPHDEGETAAVGESTDPQDQHPKQPDQPRT